MSTTMKPMVQPIFSLLRLLCACLPAVILVAQPAATTAVEWFERGESKLRSKEFDEAARAFQEAERLGYLARSTQFRAATAFAAKGDTAEALAHLGKAIEVGFAALPFLDADPAFGELRGLPQFKELRARAMHPCRNHSGYRKLDFWVGDWDVVTNDARRTPAGTNRIEKTLDGCAVIENWLDVSGIEGKSFFAFNLVTGKWKQLWVQANTDYKEKEMAEELAGGAVRFQGTIAAPGGRVIYDRTTLTPMPDGTVRQHIEQARDGVNWQTVFDAIYVRAK